ncbi:MAG: MATE family efflux transporter, partial [Candidatus Bathyarchaeota archaeon]|nr:MATE family efflux transporter [Candidatus Bathyarchaeota archaeon]
MNVESKAQPSLSKVARGAFYLYFSMLVANFLGYVFWFVVSKLNSPDVVGLASTVITIATLAQAFTMFGVSTGVQRFLGKAYAENDVNSLKTYFSAGLLLPILASGLFVCGIVLLNELLSSLTGLPRVLVVLAGLLTFVSNIHSLFYALFISTLKTKPIVFVNFSASISR